jgi:hypothetical protein
VASLTAIETGESTAVIEARISSGKRRFHNCLSLTNKELLSRKTNAAKLDQAKENLTRKVLSL